ncbi:TRAP transporter substrate-binding protein [Elioraea sp.]|uniref:TRAP transporter substrate-binding protein n=1 Tax=Elioraea sp. TaxID=2185103 RepID=UPI0025C024EC|nr:TRAP transporter substrate-binding protein [Elioraea sp.]
MKTTRRTALLGAAGLLAAPSIARGQGQVRLTLGHNAARGNPRWVAADHFAELVKTRSNGRIEVRVAGAAQLGDDLAMLTGLRTGTLDISVNSQGPSSSLVPEMAALGLPFLFATNAQAYRLVDGPVGQNLAKRFEPLGLLLVSYWDNGIRHITNSRRPINTPDDLRGLKIRTPADPATIDTFQALGAATQQINFSELYVALQQGVVDGQENPLANIHSSKLFEVNKYISLSAHKWESTPVLFSRIARARINDADWRLLLDAMKEAEAMNRRIMVESDTTLLAEFKANANVAVNEANQGAFRTATAGVLDAWEKRPFGEFVREVRRAATA